MLKLDYMMQSVVLTKKSVKTLVVVNPRKTHAGQVNSIYNSLLKREHFDSVFVVNVIKGVGTRIIDGNHRIQALKKFFEKYPSERIQAYFATYRELSEEQERAVFTKWNISVSQSTDDFLHSYRETIPMYERLTTEMPCSIYGAKNKMKLRDLVNAYSASFEKPYRGGESKTKINVVRYFQRLVGSDVDKIKKIFGLMMEIFNADNTKDWRNKAAFKNIIFRALYYIINSNIDRIDEKYLVKRMKTVLADTTLLNQHTQFYGRRASVAAYTAFLNILNDTASSKKFV